MGLGLYLVKSILDAHNEDIAVTSADGLTEFVFTLTLAREKPRSEKSKAEKAEKAKAAKAEKAEKARAEKAGKAARVKAARRRAGIEPPDGEKPQT